MTIVCVKQCYTQFPPHTHTHNIHKKIKCTLFFCLLNPQLLQLLTEWECCEQSDCVTPAANHFFHFPQNWYWLNVDSGHVFHNFWPGKSADYLYQNVPDEQYELKRRYVVSRLNEKVFCRRHPDFKKPWYWWATSKFQHGFEAVSSRSPYCPVDQHRRL